MRLTRALFLVCTLVLVFMVGRVQAVTCDSIACSNGSQCVSYCAATVPPGVPYFPVCFNRCCECRT